MDTGLWISFILVVVVVVVMLFQEDK